MKTIVQISKKLIVCLLMVSIYFVSSIASASLYESLEPKKFTFSSNSIHYVDVGEGIPIIFIHGWSSHKGYWKEQIELFSSSNRVIAYDWRGMGASKGGEEPYEFSELVEDLRLFIDNLNLKQKPILVGHSLGGLQAMHFAAMYPDVPAAIISVDAPGRDNLITGRIMYWAMSATYALTSFLSDYSANSLQVPFNRFFFYSSEFIERNESFIQTWEKQFKSNSVNSLINAFRAMTFRIRTEKTVKGVPALFVMGSEDRFISQAQTEDYSSLFPGSKFEVITGAGHMSSEEQPDYFNQLLESFIDKTLLNQATNKFDRGMGVNEE